MYLIIALIVARAIMKCETPSEVWRIGEVVTSIDLVEFIKKKVRWKKPPATVQLAVQ